MRLINYRCPKCGREAESLYMDKENVPSQVPCTCERDVYMTRWDFKNNSQRARIFDKQAPDEVRS